MADPIIAIRKLIGDEGGYADKDNNNGAVKYGITEHFAEVVLKVPKQDCKRFIRELSRDEAEQIYLVHFWNRFHLGEFLEQRVANALLYGLVNMNPTRPISFAQQAANKQRMGTHLLEVDGVLGPKTITAINACDPEKFLQDFNGYMLTQYTMLARTKPELYGDDLPGWKKRVEAASA